eukprot:1917297-Rhodomonas_salina.1
MEMERQREERRAMENAFKSRIKAMYDRRLETIQQLHNDALDRIKREQDEEGGGSEVWEARRALGGGGEREKGGGEEREKEREREGILRRAQSASVTRPGTRPPAICLRARYDTPPLSAYAPDMILPRYLPTRPPHTTRYLPTRPIRHLWY